MGINNDGFGFLFLNYVLISRENLFLKKEFFKKNKGV